MRVKDSCRGHCHAPPGPQFVTLGLAAVTLVPSGQTALDVLFGVVGPINATLMAGSKQQEE